MPRAETLPLPDRIFARRFDDPEVVAALDAMVVPAVVRALTGSDDESGLPDVTTHYAEPLGSWRQGDGRPPLADEDPAVAQAQGRCAANRIRLGLPSLELPANAPPPHPEPCCWCDYPVADLLAACDWSTFRSRLILTEILTWWQRPTLEGPLRGLAYRRSGRDGVRENPRHAEFWSLPVDEREALVRAAQYPDQAAAA